MTAILVPPSPVVQEYGATQEIAHLNRIARIGIDLVDRKYGVDYLDLAAENPLAGHNGDHTRGVKNRAGALAIALGLPKLYVSWAEALGASHDVYNEFGHGIDEVMSAEWVMEQLRLALVFDDQFIEESGMVIRATLPEISDGYVTGHSVNRMKFKTTFGLLVAKCLVSADFGDVHTEDGPLKGHRYYAEAMGCNRGEEPPFGPLIPYQLRQLYLWRNLDYPLAEAEELLAPYREETTEYQAKVLYQLKNGEITSHSQLIEQDEVFKEELLAA